MAKKADDGFVTSSMCLPSPRLCVQVKIGLDSVQVRDSKTGEIQTYDHGEWSAFIGGVKRGEFDLPSGEKLN